MGWNETIDERRLPYIFIQQPATLLPLQTENVRDGQEEFQAPPPFPELSKLSGRILRK